MGAEDLKATGRVAEAGTEVSQGERPFAGLMRRVAAGEFAPAPAARRQRRRIPNLRHKNDLTREEMVRIGSSCCPLCGHSLESDDGQDSTLAKCKLLCGYSHTLYTL
jgi:hypothetical protein